MSELREAIRTAIVGAFPTRADGSVDYCLYNTTIPPDQQDLTHPIERMIDRVLDVLPTAQAPDPDWLHRIMRHIDEETARQIEAKLSPPPVAKTLQLGCQTRSDVYRSGAGPAQIRIVCIDHSLTARGDSHAEAYAELVRLHRAADLL